LPTCEGTSVVYFIQHPVQTGSATHLLLKFLQQLTRKARVGLIDVRQVVPRCHNLMKIRVNRRVRDKTA